MLGGGALLKYANKLELVSKLRAAEAACSFPEVFLHSAKSQVQVICASESSLLEEFGRLQSDETTVKGRCELCAWSCAPTRHS